MVAVFISRARINRTSRFCQANRNGRSNGLSFSLSSTVDHCSPITDHFLVFLVTCHSSLVTRHLIPPSLIENAAVSSELGLPKETQTARTRDGQLGSVGCNETIRHPMAHLHFVGVLANAHTSVTSLDFSPCICRSWPYEKLVRFIACQEGLPKWSIYPRVDLDFVVHKNRRGNVCVLEGDCDVPDGNSDENFLVRHDREELLVRLVEHRIRLLRLFESGNLMLIAHYFYEQHGRRTEPISQGWYTSGVTQNVFKVTKARARWLNAKVSEMPTQFQHEYLNLALTSLDRSYRETDHIVAFLMLMIGFEALFNAGKQELRYRLCRGLAILCGRTLSARQAIFYRAKKVYDRRSVLLHTGKQDDVTDADVAFIRHHLRLAILAAYRLNLPKDALSLYLTEAGFRSAPHADFYEL